MKGCGNEFLQELLIPSRLDKAMRALDTDGSGVIEIEEWCVFAASFIISCRS